jgi:intracellular multiplication protein IcmK
MASPSSNSPQKRIEREVVVRPGRLTVMLLVGGLLPVASFAQTIRTPPAMPPSPLGSRTDLTEAVPASQGLDSLDPAGQRAVQNAIPLTPEMIEELQRRYGAVQQAAEQATQQLAFPVSRLISVTFAPGQATSIIQTVRGYPTAISFFDATGQPWPIGWNTNSNAANAAGGINCNASPAAAGGDGSPSVSAVGFYVCVPVKGSNTIEITPMSLVPRGGLVVNLQNGPKPLSFLMIAGHDRYDADMSVHLSDRGPNAKVTIDTRPGAPVTGAPYLNAMLAGVAPAEAVPLDVSGVSPDAVLAWRLGGETYLRTRYTLMSPAWDASESGEGGITIYAIPSTPVVLLSAESRTVSASLKESR